MPMENLVHLDPLTDPDAAVPSDDARPRGGRANESDVDDDGTVEDRTDWLDLEVVISVDGETLALSHLLSALTLGEDGARSLGVDNDSVCGGRGNLLITGTLQT